MRFQNNKSKKIYSTSQLKYILRKIIIPFGTIFLISSIIYANEDIQVLEMINEARAVNNLSILQYSNILEKAAKNHANYLSYHQICVHEENKSLPFFTGEEPWDRALFLGYYHNLITENIHCSPHNSWKKSVDSLFTAIYHRFGFLQRNFCELGYASSKGMKQESFVFLMGSIQKCQKKTEDSVAIWDITVEYPFSIITINNDHTSKKNTITLYPWPNQQDVYPIFYDQEEPDPTPFSVSGNPISVQFNSSIYRQVEIISFSLTDAHGKQLETWDLNSKNDVHKMFSPFDFAWFPLQPLQWDSQYSVQLKYKVDEGEIQEKKWSFKTKKSK